MTQAGEPTVMLALLGGTAWPSDSVTLMTSCAVTGPSERSSNQPLLLANSTIFGSPSPVRLDPELPNPPSTSSRGLLSCTVARISPSVVIEFGLSGGGNDCGLPA